jgi:predicted aspartyl protease
MSFRFETGSRLIVVSAAIEGPTGTAVLRLALDTGATCCVVNPSLLTAIGYDLALAPDRVEMTTGSGIEYSAQVELIRLTALGLSRSPMPVLAHSLPPTTGVDGLLGVDCFVGRKLTIDFAAGAVVVE